MNKLIQELITYHRNSVSTHKNCNNAKGKFLRIGKRRKNQEPEMIVLEYECSYCRKIYSISYNIKSKDIQKMQKV